MCAHHVNLAERALFSALTLLQCGASVLRIHAIMHLTIVRAMYEDSTHPVCLEGILTITPMPQFVLRGHVMYKAHCRG